MNNIKRLAKEATIVIIEAEIEYLKSSSVIKNFRSRKARIEYLTKTKEKHENALHSDKILRTRAEKFVNKVFRRQSQLN